MKMTLDLQHNGENYAAEITATDGTAVRIAYFENAFEADRLPPAVAMVFANWTAATLPRFTRPDPADRGRLIAEVADLMLAAQERRG